MEVCLNVLLEHVSAQGSFRKGDVPLLFFSSQIKMLASYTFDLLIYFLILLSSSRIEGFLFWRTNIHREHALRSFAVSLPQIQLSSAPASFQRRRKSTSSSAKWAESTTSSTGSSCLVFLRSAWWVFSSGRPAPTSDLRPAGLAPAASRCPLTSVLKWPQWRGFESHKPHAS